MCYVFYEIGYINDHIINLMCMGIPDDSTFYPVDFESWFAKVYLIKQFKFK